MGNYAHGDTRLDFPHGNIPRMHTVSDWNIPVCIRGSHKSPYAYRDYVSCDPRDPRMHTGIDFDPCMHMGIPWHAIPVCIRGFTWSPFIAWRMWKFWFNAWLEERSLTRPKLIPIHIRGESIHVNVRGSVTANIGWYVVSILHDWPSCNIDITWPVESRLWVDRMYSFFGGVSIQNCCFPF